MINLELYNRVDWDAIMKIISPASKYAYMINKLQHYIESQPWEKWNQTPQTKYGAKFFQVNERQASYETKRYDYFIITKENDKIYLLYNYYTRHVDEAGEGVLQVHSKDKILVKQSFENCNELVSTLLYVLLTYPDKELHKLVNEYLNYKGYEIF